MTRKQICELRLTNILSDNMFAICLLHIFIGLLENLEVWNIQRKFQFDLQTQLFQSLPTRSGCFVLVLSCKANHDIARNRIREQNYLLCSLDWKRYVHLFGMHVTLPGKKKHLQIFARIEIYTILFVIITNMRLIYILLSSIMHTQDGFLLNLV